MKTRHAPPRHCRDAMVYGHTTTDMHEIEYISRIEYPPPLTLRPHSLGLKIKKAVCPFFFFLFFFLIPLIVCASGQDNNHERMPVSLLWSSNGSPPKLLWLKVRVSSPDMLWGSLSGDQIDCREVPDMCTQKVSLSRQLLYPSGDKKKSHVHVIVGEG